MQAELHDPGAPSVAAGKKNAPRRLSNQPRRCRLRAGPNIASNDDRAITPTPHSSQVGTGVGVATTGTAATVVLKLGVKPCIAAFAIADYALGLSQRDAIRTTLVGGAAQICRLIIGLCNPVFRESLTQWLIFTRLLPSQSHVQTGSGTDASKTTIRRICGPM